MFWSYDFGPLKGKMISLDNDETKLFDYIKNHSDIGKVEFKDNSQYYSSYELIADREEILDAIKKLKLDFEFFRFFMKTEGKYHIVANEWDSDDFCCSEPDVNREKENEKYKTYINIGGVKL